MSWLCIPWLVVHGFGWCHDLPRSRCGGGHRCRSRLQPLMRLAHMNLQTCLGLGGEVTLVTLVSTWQQAWLPWWRMSLGDPLVLGMVPPLVQQGLERVVPTLLVQWRQVVLPGGRQHAGASSPSLQGHGCEACEEEEGGPGGHGSHSCWSWCCPWWW